MPTYDIFTHTPVTNAVGGDYTTGSEWDEAYEQSQTDRLNVILKMISTDMTYLFALIAQGSSDTLSYSWTSNDTITVAPGLAIASDGTQHTVANNTILSLNSDLDTGVRAADTIYFIWIGKDTITNQTKLKISLNYATPPTSLVAASAYRLKNFINTNTGNSNIEQFGPALPDALPAGTMLIEPSPYKPCGTFWAHGQALPRTGYGARIFARFNTTWGVGDGSTTFNLPDTQGCSPMGNGTGSGLTVRTIGSKTGVESVSLIEENNGPHAHIGGAHTHGLRGSRNDTGSAWKISFCSASNVISSDGPTESGGAVLTTSSGSGTPFSVINPVFIGGFIIKG